MDGIISRFVRVLVSGLWAWAAVQFVTYLGIELPVELGEQVELALFAFLTAVINAAIGKLAAKYPDQWGWLEYLLGSNVKPVYLKVNNEVK